MTSRISAPWAVMVLAAPVLIAAGCVLAALAEDSLWVIGAIGASLVIATTYYSPRFGFYALLSSAMFSRYEFLFGGVSLRPDQILLVPVLIGLAPRVAAELQRSLSQPEPRLRVPTVSALVFSGLALYIWINLLSTYLFSPQFWESFKIVLWFVLSFLALAATYFVVGRYMSLREALYAVLVTGFVSGAVGIFFFVLFELTGSTVGIQIPDTATDPIYKATGTFVEANLFGSFQGFTVVAGIALLSAGGRMRPSSSVLLILGTIVSAIALALSLTRAAWLGAICGLLLLAFFQLRGGRSFVVLLRFAAVGLVSVAALAPTGLLGSVVDRFRDIGVNESSGTLAFRLERFRLALQEWPSSPFLGLGTNSYGQRHWDPTQNYAPDYLPNLVLATLYDTGILGLLVFVAIFVAITAALISVTLRMKTSRQGALALAILCGSAVLFVSYQATNGFWFSYVWIIMAVAVRACVPWEDSEDA